MKILAPAFLCSLLLFQTCQSSRILIYVLQCTYSQLHVYHPFAVRLSEAGHDVTMVLPTEFKTPNSKIKYVIPDKVRGPWKEFQGAGLLISQLREEDVLAGGTTNAGWDLLAPQGVKFCELFLNSEGITKWAETSKFDLVIVDDLLNDCGVGLAYKLKAPFMYFVTSTLFPSAYDTFGSVPETSWIPDIRKRWSGEMNFLQRVENTLLSLEMYFNTKRYSGYFGDLEKMLRSKLSMPDMPDLDELEKKANLVLVNSHFSMEVARSLPPLFVPVGGLQCGGPLKEELPKNIAEFLNKYSGFIYVSFGTVTQLSPEKQQIFLDVFQQYARIGFVMKWTGDLPKKTPANVLLVNFAPQQALLSHKKILGFVSHGGMLSTQEVTYYGVPVIGIPIFAEQDYNIECLRRLGVALKLEIATLNTAELSSTIRNLLNNPSYRLKMKKISALSRDRPQHPMDTAIWWTEYVLRNSKDNDGLDVLKPLGIHQPWYQRRCLDVWGFLFLIILLIVYIFVKMWITFIKCVIRVLCGRKKTKAD
ncbi:unnamed protein product [Allacma fusca]|uniref:Glucuronosyltransferase n=1 Tax=Allacma fusca TaxID=39272 RepID=A0A8J2JH33_9HEXA|nr:unnamed protein product [Allacma fusca]